MMVGQLIARHWPFANGSGRIVDKLLAGVDLGSGERIARTSDGFPIHVLADDHIGRHILLTGKFDRTIAQVLIDRAKPGDTLIDIGANIGYITCCFLARVQDSMAQCVEPQPEIYELLDRNASQFSGRAITHNVALSDRSGELRFHVDQGNRGASRISADGEISVPAVSAREFFAGLQKADLIKIDVEGHEKPIFRGLEPELARLRPRAILFECQDNSAAPSREIGAILTRCDYSVFGITKSLFKTSLSRIGSEEDCRFNDYIALNSGT